MKSVFALVCLSMLPLIAGAEDLLRNRQLSVVIRAEDGSYEISRADGKRPVLRAIVGAEVDGRWVKSSDYPNHQVLRSGFVDAIGKGQQVTVIFAGVARRPTLRYVLRVYDDLPFGDIEVEVRNQTAKAMAVQSIRSLQAVDAPLLNLGGSESADRVLSYIFSPGSGAQRIYDLDQAPQDTHLGIGAQLVYNQDSHQSLFLGALTSRRFFTVMRLEVARSPAASDRALKIGSYTVDSTGASQAMSSSDDSYLKTEPVDDQIPMSLPLDPGKSLTAERMLFAVGDDYHAQLEAHGAAVRQLLRARVNAEVGMGWESENTYDPDITEGFIRTNAQWLAAHLGPLGFDYAHIDAGYEYVRGDWSTVDAAKFPRGMAPLSQEILRLGLKVGGWVDEFVVEDNSWVSQYHKEWLVRNERGQPLKLRSQYERQNLYLLDPTHPSAQKYLRQMYQTLVRQWGWTHIHVDGLDQLFEGRYYRPHITALEAQRIGLDVIREAVGDDVLLIFADGPVLNAVGLFDVANVVDQPVHNFISIRQAGINLASRYYMNGAFFLNNHDCFNVGRQLSKIDALDRKMPEHPLSLDEAQSSIVLAAMSGGAKYCVGDDLPTLGSEPERLALVTNPELLQLARLGWASKPLDLMTYLREDEQPSVFFLGEDRRQSMLAVFNWTDLPRSHALELSELGLAATHPYKFYDVLRENKPVALDNKTIRLTGQPPHSVQLLKIVDESQPPMAPTLAARVPDRAKIREDIEVSVSAARDGVPALEYHWDFGDGVSADGATLRHTYTLAGDYTVSLTAKGVDGVAAHKTFSISVAGLEQIGPPRPGVP